MLLKPKNILFLVLFIFSINLKGQVKFLTEENVLTTISFQRKDVHEVMISDQYYSDGVLHVYFHESIKGIPVVNSTGSLHISKFGSGLKSNNLIGNLTSQTVNLQESLTELQSLNSLFKEQKLDKLVKSITFSSLLKGNKSGKKFKAPDVAKQDIQVEKKIWYDEKQAKLIPIWDVVIDEKTSNKLMQYWLDAKTGKTINTNSLTISCGHGCSSHHHQGKETNVVSQKQVLMSDSSYFVYPWPLDSPNFGLPSLVRKPDTIGRVASPSGWHRISGIDYLTTRGNNVDCYEDTNDDDIPTNGDASRASGGSALFFNYPIDHNLAPSFSQKASIVNTFYWSNIIHDVLHQYGFNEVSGNFQAQNFTGLGSGGDHLKAQVQDGSGTCNANFSTPPDGLSPTMQMYVCGNRDGGFDNGVIAHEIGHGLSIRLTGGPSNVNCLNNEEQMGEGWSDFLGMILTIRPTHNRNTPRPVGTWLFEQGPTGGGIRPYPYSADFAINPMTYNTIKQSGISVPHGLGSVWCTILWEMTWDLIDAYGFDPNIYHGNGGNNIALRLVVEGLKLQPCSPGFVDGRDAILLADKLLYNDAHACLLRKAFARRGLGFGASQGSSGSRTDGVESFTPFPECFIDAQLLPLKDTVKSSDTLSYRIRVKNNQSMVVDSVLAANPILRELEFISANKSPVISLDTIQWKFSNLGVGSKDSSQVNYKVNFEPGGYYFFQTFDGLVSNFTTSTNGASAWSIINSSRPAMIKEYYAPNVPTISRTILEYAPTTAVDQNSTLSFEHKFDTEAWFDFCIVQISDNGGSTWQSLSDKFINNGYNTSSRGGPSFSGTIGSYINSVIDLSSYAGKIVKFRFIIDSDYSIGGDGWRIDNLGFGTSAKSLNGKLVMKSNNIKWEVNASKPVHVTPENHFTIDVAQITCYGLTNGSIKVSSSNLKIDSIKWANGSKDTILANLGSGTYNAKIYSNNKIYCIESTIFKYDSLRSSLTSTNQEGPLLGSANLIVSGGFLPYTITWSNGQTGNTLTNLTAGQYIATIIDNKGCQIKDTATIINLLDCTNKRSYRIEFQGDQYAFNEVQYQISDENGNVLKSDFNFLPNGGKDTVYICVPQTVCYKFKIFDTYGDGLCENYSVPQGYYRIYDVNNNLLVKEGCNYGFVDSFSMCPTQALQITGRTINHESCSLGDGSISVTASGGLGQLNYSWQGYMQNSSSLSNLQPGKYILTVSDQINQMIKDTIYVRSHKVGYVEAPIDGAQKSFRVMYNLTCQPDTIMISKNFNSDTIYFSLGELMVDRAIKVINENPNKRYFYKANPGTAIFNISTLGNLNLNKLSIGSSELLHTSPVIINNGGLTLDNVEIYFKSLLNATEAISNKGTLNYKGLNKLMKNQVLD
jgi:hypothetical protein